MTMNVTNIQQYLNSAAFMPKPGIPGQDVAQPTPTTYDREPSFYGLSDEDNHGPLRLYEERLVAHRNRAKRFHYPTIHFLTYSRPLRALLLYRH